jgi:hypothetical protein
METTFFGELGTSFYAGKRRLLRFLANYTPITPGLRDRRSLGKLETLDASRYDDNFGPVYRRHLRLRLRLLQSGLTDFQKTCSTLLGVAIAGGAIAAGVIYQPQQTAQDQPAPTRLSIER